MNSMLKYNSPPKTITSYIGIGSNIGSKSEKITVISHAVDILKTDKNIILHAISSVYESKAWGITDQEDFFNLVIEISTEYSPDNLLKVLKEIEVQCGRERSFRWGPRKIDLDILLYGNRLYITDNLIIPHKHLLERNFVIIPLLEIAPQVLLPNGMSIKEATHSQTLIPGIRIVGDL